EPVVEARVQVIRQQWWHGRRVWVEVQQFQVPFQVLQTDDLGKYRIENLEPGTYYIRATRRSKWMNIDTFLDGPGQPEMSQTPAFYPSSSTLDGASPIRILA